MRVLAISDIHGCDTAFEALLAAIAPRPGDLIVTLGDYVDRGPDSKGVIDRLLQLRLEHEMISLRGNHEIMMLGARADETSLEAWCGVGGDTTLASYPPGTLEDVPPEHWEFIENQLLDWYETETHIFVHANLQPDLPLADQNDMDLFWMRFSGAAHFSGKVMVCGHTRQRSGLPLNLGHAICLDTGAYAGGWISCLDTGVGWLWQANQNGEVRQGWLDDLSKTWG